MIRLMLGGVGSGKTACMVRELMLNPSRKVTFSNIITKGIKSNHRIESSMIIDKELKEIKKSGEEIYKYSVNQTFWKKVVKKHKSINVVLDEAHTLIDSRRSMSKLNKCMSDFMALLRRIIGANEAGYGELVLISQIERRLDIIAKEMATQVRYHICFYKKKCLKCNRTFNENNETAEPVWRCQRCGSYEIRKCDHVVKVFMFSGIQPFINWKYFQRGKPFRKYFVWDIEDYFDKYDTFQWENLISEL